MPQLQPPPKQTTLPKMNHLTKITWPTSPSDRVLILCVSQATKTQTLRHIANRGGALATEVTTITGLAAKLTSEAPTNAPQANSNPENAINACNAPLWQRIGGRPELQDLARKWLDQAKAESLAPAQLGFDFAPLFAHPFAEQHHTTALKKLAKSAAENGPKLGADLNFNRVYAIGFGPHQPVDGTPSQTPAPWAESRMVPKLLIDLKAELLAAPVITERCEVPIDQADDVAAEARWVAERVAEHRAGGGALDRVLVLSANQGDEVRTRSALRRSGLAACEEGSRPLSEHGLCALIHRIAPWFTDDAPMISGRVLQRLVQSKLLGSGWVAKGSIAEIGRIDQTLRSVGLTEPEERLSRGKVPKVLKACRLVRADVQTWIAALKHVASDTHGESVREWERGTAVYLSAALQWLQSCRTRHLVQSGSVPAIAALVEFLTAFGIAGVEGGPDFIALRILRALQDNNALPVTRRNLQDALAGAYGTGAIGDGVVLLGYDEYDYRDAELLLLTGLHSGGLGALPNPDPLLTDDQLALLGQLRGERLLRFRQAMVAAAVQRAGRALGCVAERDATGRPVAPWLTLDATVAPTVTLRRSGDITKNYGLQAKSPETQDVRRLRRVLEPIASGAIAAAIENASQRHRFAGLAATIEWVRAGSHVQGYAPEPVDEDADLTLLDHLNRHRPAIPAPLLPWLGDTTAVPDAALPADHVMSATSVFEPMTACGYKLFCKTRLRLKATEELAEELDARELGTVAHEAIEQVGASTRWRVEADEKTQAIDEITSAIHAEMKRQIDARAAHTEGLRAAEDATLQRWQTHWRAYVTERMQTLDPSAAMNAATASAIGCEAWGIALARLNLLTDPAVSGWTAGGRGDQLKKWLAAAIMAVSAGEDPCADHVLAVKDGPSGKWRPTVAAAAQDAVFQDALRDAAKLVADALPSERALRGPIVGGLPEWSFGSWSEDGDACEIELDGVRANVRGSVDLVRVTGAGAERALHIIDYKTWGGKEESGDLAAGIRAGTAAQLPLYALVALKRRHADDAFRQLLPDPPVAVTVAYDRVKRAKAIEGTRPQRDGEDIDLAATERLFGTLLTKARGGEFLLIPHADKCPKIQARRAYCDYAEVCRFRVHAGALPAMDAAEEVAS